MLFSTIYAKVVDSLWLILYFFVRASFPMTTPLLTSSYPKLLLPVICPPATHLPSSGHVPLAASVSVIVPFFQMTGSLLPQSIPPLSSCLCLPLSMQRICSCQSTIAYLSGLIWFASVERPGLKLIQHTVYYRVDIVVGFSDRNFLWSLCWYWDFFASDCRNVYHGSHLLERNTIRNWVTRDSLCLTCSFRIQEG